MLTEALVQKTLTHLLDCVLPTASTVEYRLVGTAAMLLRSVHLPSNDIDLLFRERKGIDLFHQELMRSPTIEQHQSPAMLEGAGQYFARYSMGGVVVEMSTVEFEIDTENDTVECLGGGPWEHYDLVPCGSCLIPVVATELRLLTELRRNRMERVQPILAYLRTHPPNTAFIQRGLIAHNIPQELRRIALEQIEQAI
jgi:hypothetical protein